MYTQFPSALLESAIKEISKLPGVGRKSALKLALHLLRQSPEEVDNLCLAISDLNKKIRYCNVCRNISDQETCEICANTRRDHSLVCVVESIKEVIAIENTAQYNGVYHVLGGVISPIDGIGPSALFIEQLLERVAKGGVKEIIFALSSTMEGDTTTYYIYKKLSQYPITISTISRGISVGDEIEYADEITLGSSIRNRIQYKETF